MEFLAPASGSGTCTVGGLTRNSLRVRVRLGNGRRVGRAPERPRARHKVTRIIKKGRFVCKSFLLIKFKILIAPLLSLSDLDLNPTAIAAPACGHPVTVTATDAGPVQAAQALTECAASLSAAAASLSAACQ